MNVRWKLLLSLGLAVLVTLSALTAVQAQVPQLPHLFFGTVTVASNPASVGTVVTAKVGGVERGSITITQASVYGGPGALDPKPVVQGEDIAAGSTVQFFVDGVQADQTFPFDSGAVTQLNLTAAAAPPPTPTPGPAPPPAPTPTPEPTPTPTPTPVVEITPPEAPEGVEQVVETISPEEETTVIATAVDVTVGVPADSVTESVQIAVRTVTTEEIPPAATGFTLFDIVFTVDVFDVAGNLLPDFEFETEITITIDLSDLCAEVPGGLDCGGDGILDDIEIQRFNEKLGVRESLETVVDSEALTATVSIKSLSLFALVLRQIITPTEPDVVGVIRATEATTIGAPDGSVLIDVPRAVTTDTIQLGLTLLAAEDVPGPPEGIAFTQKVFRIDLFDLSSEALSGFRFDRSIAVTVQFISSDLARVDNDIFRIVILRFEEPLQQWIILPTTVDLAELTATASSSRFSLFALGLVGVEVLPTPISEAELIAKRAERPIPPSLVDSILCNLFEVRCE